MSYMKEQWTEQMEKLSGIELFDFLVDHGWSYDEALEYVASPERND